MAMDYKILVINTGSASKKYSFYSEEGNVLSAHFEFEKNEPIVTFFQGGKKTLLRVSSGDYQNACDIFLNNLLERRLISDFSEIKAIGIRVVAPGSFFTQHRLLTPEYLETLRMAKENDPIHIEPVLDELKMVQKKLSCKIYMISDSAFHITMPDYAKSYAINKDDAQNFDIFRFGYHGLSVQSVVRRISKELAHVPEKMIICHLGGGSSVTALYNGKSLDNSMGFSPLEGLPMASRVGSIDIEAAMHLAIRKNFSIPDMRKYFYNECGIKGMSGISSDTRILIAERDKGDRDAGRALAYFAHSVKKYIGAYTYVLGGLNALVFTGTIGERSAPMRSMICQGLEYLDTYLDDKLNAQVDSRFDFIHNESSKVAVVVVPTDEMGEIAKETLEFLLHLQ
jgi:acetate kinase